MGYESFSSAGSGKTFDRAQETMRRIRSGQSKTVPEAVRQILINERITHPPDVKRIQSEVATMLNAWKEENKIWDEKRDEENRLGAEQAQRERGGDPED